MIATSNFAYACFSAEVSLCAGFTILRKAVERRILFLAAFHLSLNDRVGVFGSTLLGFSLFKLSPDGEAGNRKEEDSGVAS